MRLWRRGVDTERFAPDRRSERWRREVAPAARSSSATSGRLAPEKQVEDLRAIAGLPGARLVDHRRRSVAGSARADAARGAFHRVPRRRRARRGDGEPRRVRAPRRERDVLPDHPGGARERRAGRRHRAGRPARPRAQQRRTDGCTARATSTTSASGCATSPATMRSGARSASARGESVAGRGWDVLGDELLGHYEEARRLPSVRRRSRPRRRCARRAEDGARCGRLRDDEAISAVTTDAPASAPRPTRSGARPVAPVAALRRRRRLPHRGTVRRLPHAGGRVPRLGRPARAAPRAREPRRAGRRTRTSRCAAARWPTPSTCSCRVAIALGPTSSACSSARTTSSALAADAAAARRAARGRGRAVRATGADVLLVTPFMPDRPASRLFDARFAAFADALAAIADEHGAMLLDVRGRAGARRPRPCGPRIACT